MRFDTRHIKPKVWNIAVLSAAVIVLAVLLAYLGGERRAGMICIVLDLYFLAVLALLLFAYRGQIQYNPYSYNTIFYMGFALFDLSVFVTFLFLTVRVLSRPESGAAEPDAILSILLNSAKSYMLLSFPFILAFSAALCVSNISLIRHEGKRFVNVLGIVLSFLLVGGEAFLMLFDHYIPGSLAMLRLHELCGNLFAAVYLYFECMLIGIIVAFWIVSRYEPEPDRDFLIVLGCGIRKDGTPTPLLKGRLDRALQFRDRQLGLTGKDLIFVTSGGQGGDEIISESASMKRYLMEQGVPEERIIEEDRSADTFENMKFSKEKIMAADPEGRVAFSTTNYHVFRGGLYARRVKMRAVGMGAKTKWYFWPNASVREFVGLLTEHRLKQGLIFGGLLALYAALTLLVYR